MSGKDKSSKAKEAADKKTKDNYNNEFWENLIISFLVYIILYIVIAPEGVLVSIRATVKNILSYAKTQKTLFQNDNVLYHAGNVNKILLSKKGMLTGGNTRAIPVNFDSTGGLNDELKYCIMSQT